MTKLSLLVLIICSFIGCQHKSQKLTSTTIGEVATNSLDFSMNQDEITILSRINKLSIRQLVNVLRKDFFIFNLELQVNRYYESADINIYTVKVVNDDIPTNQRKDYTVVDLRKKGIQYIIPLEINQLFLIDEKLMFGGIYNYREYDFYAIYKLEDDTIFSEINSRDINGKRIIIGYYKDDECQDYYPNRFYFDYKKETKEISFNGVIDSYCKPGTDRFEHNTVVKSVKSIIYFSYQNSEWTFNHEKSMYDDW